MFCALMVRTHSHFLMATSLVEPDVIASQSILNIGSYNCRGFNRSKREYISSVLSKVDMLFLQGHWLVDDQLGILSEVSKDFRFHAVSEFGKDEVLVGRPYGACDILWRSSLAAHIHNVHVNNRRVCAVRVCTDMWKLLFCNVYMPFEDGDKSTDEFIWVLSIIRDIIEANSDCRVIFGGDLNVDFARMWSHTAILRSFCEDVGLVLLIVVMITHVILLWNVFKYLVIF